MWVHVDVIATLNSAIWINIVSILCYSCYHHSPYSHVLPTHSLYILVQNQCNLWNNHQKLLKISHYLFNRSVVQNIIDNYKHCSAKKRDQYQFKVMLAFSEWIFKMVFLEIVVSENYVDWSLLKQFLSLYCNLVGWFAQDKHSLCFNKNWSCHFKSDQ